MSFASFTASLFSCLALIAALTLLAIRLGGQPPDHCRYLVPVKGHPHVLGCSEYPRPITYTGKMPQ